MSDTSSLRSLEDRLTRLETRLARYRASAVLVAVLLLGGGLLFGQNRVVESPVGPRQDIQPPLTVEDSVTVVDGNGTTRALLTTIDDGTSLVLFDIEGRPRVGLTAGYRTAVTLYDEDARARAVLGATSLVPSHVEASDGTIERAPVSSLVLFGDDGAIVERLP